MKVCNVISCSFPVWYPKFSKIAAESIIIDLPGEFTDYLKADGVVLPDSLIPGPNEARVDSDSDSDSEVDWSSADKDVVSAPNFPELDAKMKKAIDDLGGKIYPKLNWSAPKDAIWIAMNKSPCCYILRDIYLLLKSSYFISQDLTRPFKYCTDEAENKALNVEYKLILRKWIEIDPAWEFRCFVRNNQLIAISQRDHCTFYSYIKKSRRDILRDIMSFYKEHLKNKFFDDDFVFDIYRKCKDEVKLVDLNPFGKTTESLLFHWAELEEGEFDSGYPEMRFVDVNGGIQPSPSSRYGVPRDMLDLTTGQDPYKLIDLLALRNRGSNEIEFSSDEDRDD